MPGPLKPKQVTVTTRDGEEREYTISRFPAIAGREIVAGYPLTAVPKFGEYKANEQIMLKLMGYVYVQAGEKLLPLTTQALIDNHVPDFETLVKLEIEMMRYNTSFFEKGEISTFCADFAKKLLVKLSPTLTPLLERLSVAIKQRLKS